MMSVATLPLIPQATAMIAATREAVFTARNLSKVYRRGEVEVHALRSADLDLYQGGFVVIPGPSGGGKSTLLNILGGLAVPTSGEVIFRDHLLTQADDCELTRRPTGDSPPFSRHSGITVKIAHHTPADARLMP